MHASGGVQAAPKWKHAPAPLARHVKYAAPPAGNTHVGAGQPIAGTTTATAGAGPGFAGVPGLAGFTGAAATGAAGAGCFGSAAGPHPAISAATNTITW